jgi:hypothetical protein
MPSLVTPKSTRIQTPLLWKDLPIEKDVSGELSGKHRRRTPENHKLFVLARELFAHCTEPKGILCPSHNNWQDQIGIERQMGSARQIACPHRVSRPSSCFAGDASAHPRNPPSAQLYRDLNAPGLSASWEWDPATTAGPPAPSPWAPHPRGSIFRPAEALSRWHESADAFPESLRPQGYAILVLSCRCRP